MCRCLCWFLWCSVLSSVAFGKLPDEVTKCKMSDATCLREQTALVLRKYSKGFPGMGLVSVDPLVIDGIKVADSKDTEGATISISLSFTNVNIFGITEAMIESFKIKNTTDNKSFELYLNLKIPRARILGHYEIGGRMLLLPITGSGPSNLTLINLELKAQLQGTYMEYHGKYYMYLKTFKTKINTDRVYINMENLFNGNQVLGESMNLMMNENWQEIFNELKSAFVNSFGGLFMKAANGVFAKNPIHKLFLAEDPK